MSILAALTLVANQEDAVGGSLVGRDHQVGSGAVPVAMDTGDCEAGLTEVDELPCPSSALPVLAPPKETLPVTRAESLISAGVEEETICEAQEMETELNEELSSQGDPEVDDARGAEPNPMSGSSLPKSESDPNFDPEDEAQGESLFPCPHCERHFTTKQGLERHTHIHVSANLHTHTFKCRYCGKLFGSQAGRRRHERRHESGLKKRPGSLAGTASSQGPSLKTDGLSSNLTATDGSILVMDSLTSGVTPEPPGEGKKGEGVAEVERAHLLDENGESKELHLCKYCKKAFSSHTNMRRHQRRIHERHLLPKGIRRKGSLLQEVQPGPQQSATTPHGSLAAIPQLVYQPSHEVEDECDREEEYMVDISSNISENLSLYIDGKILSTGTVSGCEVIEVDAGSAALLGLNTVIISQALKVETASNVRREVPSTTSQTLKRRTSTPPLLPKIKTESESSSSSASSSSSSASSSSSSSLAGTIAAPAVDGLSFPKEKTVYLSPKLKQLLQNQEGHRLTPPAPRLSVSPLSSGSGRFKRRTTSPPHSPPQEDPTSKGQSSEAGAPFALKVPKLESHVRSPAWSREDRDAAGSPRADWMGSLTGGSPCNQQPLDLSGAPGKNSDGTDQGEAVLDLSMHCKSLDEIQPKAGPAPQSLSKKRKPNTSILEKVLMKEYSGLELAEEEVPDDQGSPVAQPAENAITDPSPDVAPSLTEVHGAKSTVPSTSPHPPPPSLTPVPLNPPSPCAASLVSSTPPPPILPTVSSPLCQPCQSPECGPVPVLSPKTSKLMLVGQEGNSPSAETGSVTVNSERLPDEGSSNSEDSKDQEHLTQSLISLMNPKISTAEPCTDSESVCVPPSGPSEPPGDTRMSPVIDLGADESVQSPVDCVLASKADQEHKAKVQPQPPSPSPPILEASHPAPASNVDPSAPSERLPPSLLITQVIKEESDHKEEPANSAGDAPEKPTEPETFCKSFVCNVCEEPFCSMKELRCHIMAHAQDWPFKCEFCVQLFGNGDALLEHRSTLHGVGRIYVCSTCSKEFAFFCNLQQHQLDLHPGQSCMHTVLENGKLRPQNFTDPTRASTEPLLSTTDSKPSADCDDKGNIVMQKEEQENDEDEEVEMDDPTEELYTTIKIMASEGGKRKGPDVRLGINQHYPSFKPPPFPYHNRTSSSSVESATNFTTHNIPQTFSTAIRCTKCGKSFDNMPELHKHILSCANASDKRRYTPKKNPIPLRQAVKPLNGTLSPAATANVAHATLYRMGQPKRLDFGPEPTGKTRLSSLSKKDQLVQRGLSQRNRSTTSSQSEEEQGSHVCPHCQREFTYRGSLNKHMTVSCPKKPASSGSKMHADSITQERNHNLRSARRTADPEVQKEVSDLGSRTAGRSRAGSSGLAEGANSVPVKAQPARGRPTASQAQLKNPTSSSSSPAASIPLGKKSRGLPAPQQSPPHSPPAQRPLGRMQRGSKEVLPKKVSEVTSPLLQSKKEERFAVKARDRVGGPVTRSLQLANAMPSGDTEDPPNQEPEETQESSLKLER
ncbi:PR domain zinc finger protein 2 isoform X1 [Conger conger]|uniref:PR domain zinc finger protein 2 isoform X1 n=2 Tax=Conger conger TaxID=82655 RepID=UPI002A59A04A|nr:PR domain zinc finger protein 2 isoform X1 [Conger conger]XP_061075903.1 PR domain zinc finger protein 2 isoform X1 [Conger conger]